MKEIQSEIEDKPLNDMKEVQSEIFDQTLDNIKEIQSEQKPKEDKPKPPSNWEELGQSIRQDNSNEVRKSDDQVLAASGIKKNMIASQINDPTLR